MNEIMKIDIKRIANALVYFAEHTENLGVTKANKLLYYLDCEHLLRYGRAVLKDKYVKNPFGPVPSETYNRLVDIRELNCAKNPFRTGFDEGHELMFEYVSVIPEQIDGYMLDRIVPKKDFERIWFSESEVEIMEELSAKYYNTTAIELVQQTHRESPYNKADMFDFIDIKLYLKDHNVSDEDYAYAVRMERELEAIAVNFQGYKR
jgi:uncharacterized phage-associated protein